MSDPVISPTEEKNDTIQAEYAHPAVHPDDQLEAIKEGRDVQLKSELDTLNVWQTVKVYRNALVVCGLAGFAAATDGYQNTLSSSVIANKGFIKQFAPAGQAKLKAQHVSTFGGLFSAGQVIGQFSIQWVADWIGRKGAMWVMMSILIVSVIVESVSHIWWHWTLAKLIAGIGIGSVQATLPVYINEQAPVRIRGFVLVAYSLWFSFGGLMASIGLKAQADKHPLNWKTPVYTQYAMLGLSLIIFAFLPESPWWLVSKDKTDKAREVLQKRHAHVEGYNADHEVAVIAATIAQQRAWDQETKAQGPFAMLQGLNLKRFLIGSWPKVLQQFVGLSVFSNYSTYFYQLAGNKDPFMVTIILGCVSLLSVCCDALLVDRIGRRRMTLIGFTGACFGVTLMAIVGCFNYKSKQLGSVLVFAGTAANFFNTFQSSTSYAYLTEMPEQRFRARATGWGLAWCNCFAVLFSFTVPLMLKIWVVKTAFLFVCLGIPGTVLAYFIMPESMQRSPAEIHEMFTEGVNLRKWKGHKTMVERDLERRMQEGQF